MRRLDAAVEAGIITKAQREAIAALSLPPDQSGFSLSMVHVLWAGGCALVMLAMVLVAAEVGKGGAANVMWMCLAYAVFFFALDWVLQGRRSLRLLSSLMVVGVAICLMSAAFAWQESAGAAIVFEPWNRVPYQFAPERNVQPTFAYHPLVFGPYAPMLPVLVAGLLLIMRRAFLPAWFMIWGAVFMVFGDVYYGLRFDDLIPEWIALFGASFALFGLGWWQDLRLPLNHGFWQNKVATFAFFCAMMNGLAIMQRPYPYYYDSLLVLSVVLVAFSIFVRRPTGISMAGLGVALFCADWLDAWDNFFVAGGLLALIGLGAIVLGVRAHLIEDQLDRLLPARLRALRPEARHDPVTFGL
ncbi:MAG: hypothetical protein AAGG57_13315 [Pseudomonadota bacterium]